jgi:hypothetical protein
MALTGRQALNSRLRILRRPARRRRAPDERQEAEHVLDTRGLAIREACEAPLQHAEHPDQRPGGPAAHKAPPAPPPPREAALRSPAGL